VRARYVMDKQIVAVDHNASASWANINSSITYILLEEN
jgi:hypothetical protein